MDRREKLLGGAAMMARVLEGIKRFASDREQRLGRLREGLEETNQ